MATTVKTNEDRYLERFERFQAERGGPGWLRAVRRTAIERFAELGFPTTRHEDWKFTNVRPITETEFEEPESAQAPDRGKLERFHLANGGPRLVFVNGRFAPGLSSTDGLPAGVEIGSLAEAIDREEGLEDRLARFADFHDDAFTALNTAFLEDGGFIRIPRGAIVERPMHLLFVTVPGARPSITHPRNLILAGENCQAAVVEEYVSLGEGVYFSNGVTEVVAEDNAVLSHTVIERDSTQAYNVGTLRIQQGRTTNVASHTVLLGGAIVRNNVHPVMAGEGGLCVVNGLFIPAGTQHMDNFMRVEHAAPHCDSRQYYNGILDDRGHGVFSGRIVVHKPAQKTDAKQENRNILLSQDALVDSKPQLEIYADDVKCTHGATIGQLEAEAIFYLRARGVPEDEARAILLLGFAGECLERMKVEPVREYVEELVRQRIPRGRVIEQAA